MILWTSTNGRADAKSAYQGGPFASMLFEDGQWFVVWWVGPRTRVRVPSEAKGRAWIERFAASRLHELARQAASPDVGPNATGGYAAPTPDEKARYEAFSASYVPPRRTRKARR